MFPEDIAVLFFASTSQMRMVENSPSLTMTHQATIRVYRERRPFHVRHSRIQQHLCFVVLQSFNLPRGSRITTIIIRRNRCQHLRKYSHTTILFCSYRNLVRTVRTKRHCYRRLVRHAWRCASARSINPQECRRLFFWTFSKTTTVKTVPLVPRLPTSPSTPLGLKSPQCSTSPFLRRCSLIKH